MERMDLGLLVSFHISYSVRDSRTDKGRLGLGAGWGGATVSLVLEPDVPRFMEALKTQYYNKHHPNLTEKELEDACFATKPEMGACMFEGDL